jgi:DNA repair exonuclease SbcCD nuclease subunit
MKIALITDTHWGVRNDSSAFLEFFEKFYNNVFFPELEQRGIKTILHLGDIVDRRKYISYVTLRKMKDIFIDRCVKDGIDLHVLIGNHDVPYKNTNDINSMQELFDKNHIKYYSEPTHIDLGVPVLLMPWINNGNYARAVQEIQETKAQIMFGHLEVAGCLMERGRMSEHGMSIDQFKKFDVVASGHFHHRSTTDNIHYLGAPYEMTWGDYADQKGFHIFDTETRVFEFIANPYSMFHKVFYSDEGKTVEQLLEYDFEQCRGAYIKVIKQDSSNPYWFDLFMDELYKVEPIHIQVVDDHLNLDLEDDDDIVNEAEDTVTILSKYIETLPDNVSKKELDKLMRSLYNEAIHMTGD